MKLTKLIMGFCLLAFMASPIIASDKGTNRARIYYSYVDLAPGDIDTLGIWWVPKGGPMITGYCTLVLVPDSTVTDYGDQDSLTVVAKSRYYLREIQNTDGTVYADSTSDAYVGTYQCPTNDSTIIATEAPYTLRRPILYDLNLPVDEGLVLFLNNVATVGDSTRWHVYIYSK